MTGLNVSNMSLSHDDEFKVVELTTFKSKLHPKNAMVGVIFTICLRIAILRPIFNYILYLF